jgi:hypothetical protein
MLGVDLKSRSEEERRDGERQDAEKRPSRPQEDT